MHQAPASHGYNKTSAACPACKAGGANLLLQHCRQQLHQQRVLIVGRLLLRLVRLMLLLLRRQLLADLQAREARRQVGRLRHAVAAAQAGDFWQLLRHRIKSKHQPDRSISHMEGRAQKMSMVRLMEPSVGMRMVVETRSTCRKCGL